MENNKTTTENVAIQHETKSAIWKLGLASVIVEAILGVMLVCGLLSQELVGAIMVGFAGVLAYCNGNNPNIQGAYNVQPKDTDTKTKKMW